MTENPYLTSVVRYRKKEIQEAVMILLGGIVLLFSFYVLYNGMQEIKEGPGELGSSYGTLLGGILIFFVGLMILLT